MSGCISSRGRCFLISVMTGLPPYRLDFPYIVLIRYFILVGDFSLIKFFLS